MGQSCALHADMGDVMLATGSRAVSSLRQLMLLGVPPAPAAAAVMGDSRQCAAFTAACCSTPVSY